MNSNNTTFPRKDDMDTVWPVRPFGPTIGKAKSGTPEVDVVTVEA